MRRQSNQRLFTLLAPGRLLAWAAATSSFHNSWQVDMHLDRHCPCSPADAAFETLILLEGRDLRILGSWPASLLPLIRRLWLSSAFSGDYSPLAGSQILDISNGTSG